MLYQKLKSENDSICCPNPHRLLRKSSYEIYYLKKFTTFFSDTSDDGPSGEAPGSSSGDDSSSTDDSDSETVENQCATDGSDYSFTESVSGDTRTITTVSINVY